MSPIPIDIQSVFENACGFKNFAGCVTGAVTIIAA
jgi:hypothetical protein